ncbi:MULTISPECIES: septum site-determining protein MinC [Shewanella]|uniref:septum site-determining protein MinC n=1 Tax=Shewanella TaxID=22 RepID=UPI0010207F75|nr:MULTISPECIES: septum site-determining protein MinC [Shewanella]MBO2679536.1 septum site-determining protein MinC [Shewanella algae]MDC8853815.1 septum site-determining protein MinC [Shewanella algae]NJI84637.1 septum site-determining protein MinC [Shewanella sp. Iso12]QWL07872.1 septum site-determining protein MinC [Shewanella algae]
MPKPSLELKGSSFTLSVLHINTPDLDALFKELDGKLAQAPQFFLNAPLVLNLSQVNGTDIDLKGLRHGLTERQLVIVGVTAADKALNEAAKAQGLASIKAGKQSELPPPSPRVTKIVKQNVRSGQQIYAKDGDLIVFGAVGNGAEVIADGSIHVYGALRGKAMAGASGDKHAVILAQSMEAELVSIAGQYWLTENLQQHCTAKSGCIRLSGESLIVESLPG